jgi:predicted transcriptional regulator
METRPTNSELEILHVLWRRGPSAVREVHEEISLKRSTGYTTVLKLMQIMAEKGLVKRDEENRAHIYHAAITESDVQRGFTDDLADRVFGGSAHRLALHALGSKKATPEELAEIRRLLDAMETGK